MHPVGLLTLARLTQGLLLSLRDWLVLHGALGEWGIT